MFRRIIRSVIVFAAVIAAYQTYALVAVPWMDPPIKVSQGRRATEEDRDHAAQAVTKYQLLLSNYFPKDHWSQARPPKVIASSNEQAMLVLDDYERHEDGLVEIERFALMVFPTPPREGISPPQDAIILEAPQGAQLKFDDFRPERGQVGRITRGRFPGRITIRSNMRDPGPEDDLLVETADLEMNTKLLYTTRPVRFRMGQNVGAGRELEIRFLVDEHVQPRDSGFKMAGLDSLEIRRDVRLRLQLETDSLMPGSAIKSSRGPAADGRESGFEPSPSPSLKGRGNSVPNPNGRGNSAPNPKGRGSSAPNPPVEVTCNGPFHFDFVRYIASVDRDVELRQMNPDGPSDQLTCSQLDIHFAPKALPDMQRSPLVADPSRRQQRDLGRLEPAAIVAQGHPVVVISPARRAEARGDRIQIGLRDRRLIVAGGQEVMLVYGPNVLRAPAIDYQHPPAEAATTIGRFRATGPGSLHYMPDPAKPQQILHATWQRSVDLGRDKGQPALTLEGRPQLAFADMGSLAADRIKVYLRELQGDGAKNLGVSISGSANGDGKLQVVPDRLTATGSVEIQSPQLTGRTEELLSTFRLQPVAADGQPPADATSPLAGGANSSPAQPWNAAGRDDSSQQSFHIDADRMHIDVKLRGQSAAPSSIVCDGNVVFREVPVVRTAEQPLEIRGGRLTVDELDSGQAHIILRGGGATGFASAPADDTGGAGGRRPATDTHLAQLIGRGVTVLAEAVELDQRDNRLWSNGPGRATLIVTRDLGGRASTSPIPLVVSWQGGLEFDGRTVVFQKEVTIDGTEDRVRCDQLSARLAAPIQFGEAVDQKAIDLAEIECRGNVSIDHRTRDGVGIISHERAKLARLTINQQTGAISGDGPGEIRSTRFGEGFTTLAGPRGGGPPVAERQAILAPPGTGASKLYFLRVDFLRGLEGNIYTRELKFHQRVRTVYGPVDSWEQELDSNRPETLPPECVTLLCDALRVNEDPIAARNRGTVKDGDSLPIGPVQLQAEGNVRIDGASPGQGMFGALADRASYEQAKDVFLLEGNGRTPAKLWQRRQPGVDPTPYAARKIRYVPSTGEVKVEGIQYGEITPADLEEARRPGVDRQ